MTKEQIKYGISTEIIDDVEIQSLTTGDGKTGFIARIYENNEHPPGLIINYDNEGTHSVGDFTDLTNTPVTFGKSLLLINFTNPDSVDAMIDRLLSIKLALKADTSE